MKLVVGNDLGASKIMTALAKPSGEILATDLRPTQASQGPSVVIDRIVASIESVLDQAGRRADDLLGIGLGTPGPCNYRTGVVAAPPNLPGWRDVPLKAIIQTRLGVPTYLGNDANLGALAEHRFGAGRGTRNMIYVTVSTGIGGGLILDGRLYLGADGAAGEIGHMTIDEGGPRCNCGNIGDLEAMASGTAVAREALRRITAGEPTVIPQLAGPEGITAQVVFAAAQQGDAVAQQVIARAAHYLGVGLANLVNLFNPELIVIGGGLTRMGEMLLGPARQVVEERALALPAQTVRFCSPALGDTVGVLGAIAVVLQEIQMQGPADGRHRLCGTS